MIIDKRQSGGMLRIEIPFNVDLDKEENLIKQLSSGITEICEACLIDVDEMKFEIYD